MARVACLIVTHNHARTIARAIELTSQQFSKDDIFVWDNASDDGTKEILHKLNLLSVTYSEENLGFCAANNALLKQCLNYEFILFLNPDAAPLPSAVQNLVDELGKDSSAGAATPKILRASEDLHLLDPKTIDAAGMYFTSEFRHFDRGSGETDRGQYQNQEYVTGGTGAALLVKQSCIIMASFNRADGSLEFFDERFFAYREDAELSLRLTRLGFKTLYVPSSEFAHVRNVLPERRKEIAPELNRLSVRNRFLLQQSHFIRKAPLKVKVCTALRNILVVSGVILKETGSLPALKQILDKSTSARRLELSERSRITPKEYWKHFE